MRIEIHIYGKGSAFFAASGRRYEVVYVETGRPARREYFDDRETLKLKFAARGVPLQGGRYCKGWNEPEGCMSACLVLGG